MSGNRARPKVLVMDDSAAVLESMKLVLEQGGYDVATLSAPALLPSVWNHEKPELALLDVNMPVTSGPAVAELILKTGLRPCPLVLYGDQPERELAELASACGASGFFRATRDGPLLLSHVARHLRPAAAHAKTAARPEKLLVFVVDDEPASRLAVQAAVGTAGAEPVGLVSAEACLAALDTRRPALILMDIGLAPVSGDDCCRAIRENRAWADIPVVMISGGDATAQVMRAWRAGADDFLPKPVEARELEAKLAAVRAAAMAPVAKGSSDEGRPVLLADPSSFFRARLGRMLECSGYRMLYARTAAEVLAITKQNAGALGAVLLDLGLPGAAPAELINGVRFHCGAPVLPYSDADASSELVREAVRLTGQNAGDKKLPCEHLVSQLNRVLRRGGELRVAERVPFFSFVSFRRGPADAWSTGFTFDLSAGGVFITTLNPVARGTSIELKVVFPGREPGECRGEVIWANELCPRTCYSYSLGMGVRFSGGDAAFSKTLERYTRKS